MAFHVFSIVISATSDSLVAANSLSIRSLVLAISLVSTRASSKSFCVRDSSAFKPTILRLSRVFNSVAFLTFASSVFRRPASVSMFESVSACNSSILSSFDLLIVNPFYKSQTNSTSTTTASRAPSDATGTERAQHALKVQIVYGSHSSPLVSSAHPQCQKYLPWASAQGFRILTSALIAPSVGFIHSRHRSADHEHRRPQPEDYDGSIRKAPYGMALERLDVEMKPRQQTSRPV